MIQTLLYLLILATTCIYALRFGGQPERTGAAVVAVASVLSAAATLTSGTAFHSVEIGILIVDVVTLAVLMTIALTSNRYWPLWAAAFHSIAVMTHAAMLIDHTIIPEAYAVGQSLWAYPVLAALLAGAERCRRTRTYTPTHASRC